VQRSADVVTMSLVVNTPSRPGTFMLKRTCSLLSVSCLPAGTTVHASYGMASNSAWLAATNATRLARCRCSVSV